MNDALARQIWERKGLRGKLLWILLLPLSLLYSVGARLRKLFFRWGLIKSARLPRPVVSVGNLTVGGTGKTPTCLWLARELRKRGFRVGILSRGYRRKERSAVVLRPPAGGLITVNEAEMQASGDEPLMMAWLHGHYVGVCSARTEAAAELMRATDIDVFLLDDGYQHLRVKRDVDLLLLGADSSGWMLPAGPFREPRSSLARSDFMLVTGAQATWNELIPQHLARNSYNGSLQAVSLVGIQAQSLKEYPLSWLYRSKILTVSGVADPSGLYRLIHEYDGEIVNTLEFPDHHFYTTGDWQEINRMARQVDLIVTTEKDILKLQRFPFSKDKLLALRVAMTVENGNALVDAIVNRLRARERV
ncbi:MAG TPA: tetraacyldisaccharide 4'-kinase [Candidatus Binatia bacterium]|nr:tetraacyldisaccharide 4'-kinase [Candidatus Binatia bacterium]